VSTQAEPRDGAKRAARRPYSAPEVARVDLKADEVLGIGCKTLKTGRSANVSCVISTCGVRDRS
jgi:hypothetical protein